MRIYLPHSSLFSLILLIAVWLFLPRSVAAHVIDAPAERIVQLLNGHASGPFIVSASQYATDSLTELEVQVSAFGGRLPEDVLVRIEATSAETGQTYGAILNQHHSAFTTTLPLNGEDWQTTIEIESQFGQGSAEVTIVPYRAVEESAPVVRQITFASPLLLLLAALIVFNRTGFSLQQASPHG